MKENPDGYQVNLFRPKKGYMAEEVIVIVTILFGWAAMTFGFQLLLRFFTAAQLEGFFTRFTILGFPLHFWFTGQFLPLWFIILCIVFNLYIDRLTDQFSSRRDKKP